MASKRDKGHFEMAKNWHAEAIPVHGWQRQGRETSMAGLKKVTPKVWRQITLQHPDESMPRRTAAVIEANGGTSQFIHMKFVIS